MAIDNAARQGSQQTAPSRHTPPGPAAPGRVSATRSPAGADTPAGVWETLGKAVLAFHYRVALTAMCQCGRTVVECDVQHHARQLGLLPPLPQVEPAATPPTRDRRGFPLPPTPPGQTWSPQP